MRVELALDPAASGELLEIPAPEFRDLRADPSALDRIADARRYPRLRSVLAAINSADSVFSSVRSTADLSPGNPSASTPCGFSSSLAIVFAEEELNSDHDLAHQTATHLAEVLGGDTQDSSSRISISLSPCLFRTSGRRGVALAFSVFTEGATPEQAEMRWGLALTRLQQALLFVSRVIRRNRRGAD